MKEKLDRLLALLREGRSILESLEDDDLLGSLLRREGLPKINEIEQVLIIAGAGEGNNDNKVILTLFSSLLASRVALTLHDAVERACHEVDVKLIKFERIGNLGGAAVVRYPTGSYNIIKAGVSQREGGQDAVDKAILNSIKRRLALAKERDFKTPSLESSERG